jgi:UDP-glucose 4-epimerase
MEGYRHALVTGGAGFIGSHLTRSLMERGLQVTVLDNLSVGSADVLPSDARLVEGDVRRPEDVDRALQGVDCVFHLAAQVTIRASFERFYDDVDNNLMGTLNLVRRLVSHPVGHLTLASSMAVYADTDSPEPIAEHARQEPISPYGMSKLAAERIGAQVLSATPTRFSVVRYFNTYGPGQTFTPYVGVVTIFATRLHRGESITIFGDGAQARDFVHVDDIVQGTILTLDGPPGVYNLGTGRATTVNRVAELLRSHIHPAAAIEHEPAQPGELRYSVASIERAQRQLGYRPMRRFEQDVLPVVDAIGQRVRSAERGSPSRSD